MSEMNVGTGHADAEESSSKIDEELLQLQKNSEELGTTIDALEKRLAKVMTEKLFGAKAEKMAEKMVEANPEPISRLRVRLRNANRTIGLDTKRLNDLIDRLEI